MTYSPEISASLSKNGSPTLVVTGKHRSSNAVVQNALDAKDPYLHRLTEALPQGARAEGVEQYKALSEGLRPQFVETIEAMRDALRADARGQKINLSESIDKAFQDLSTRIQKESELEGRCRELEGAISKSNDQLSEILGKCGASKTEIEAVRNDLQILKQQVTDEKNLVDKSKNYIQTELSKILESSRTEAERQYNEFLSTHKGKCENLENDLSLLMTRATIGALSKQFEEKSWDLANSYRRSCIAFYSALSGFAILGLIAICMALYNSPEISFLSLAQRIPMSLLRLSPFVLPLVWFTCHVNRLANQYRRLMEEYAHKVVVAQTYSGLSDQVDALAKKGLDSAKDLSADLLRHTISVLCTNPNNSLDKTKTVTPLSEVVDGASRLIESVGKVK